MEQSDFLIILRKYLQGDATTEEKKLIDAWYASMEKHVSDPELPDESEWELRYWATLHAHAKNSKKKDKSKRLLPWHYAGIAASVVVMVVASFFFIEYPDDDKQVTSDGETSSLKYITNTTQATQIIVLPDSSEVALEPESRLKFSSVFNRTEREVYLEGEAFFNVTHNANLPFLVHANEVTTKVLGTSFIIKAIEHEQQITVVVKTGKVSVYTNREKEKKYLPSEEIILTPNQQIVYDKKEKEISKALVKAPRVILPEEEVRRMRFEEAPVADIFKALEKAYGVDIEFDESIFSSCELTTVISDEDIYSRLNIICNAIGTSYTLEEDKIVIKSSGCKAKTE